MGSEPENALPDSVRTRRPDKSVISDGRLPLILVPWIDNCSRELDDPIWVGSVPPSCGMY